MLAFIFTVIFLLSAIALLFSLIRADRGGENEAGYHHLAGQSANPHGKSGNPPLPHDDFS